MGKFTGVLLASDFDNTLIYTERALRTGSPVPPLSEANRNALEYFMAEGGLFAIATGRALPAFMNYAPQVPMNAPGVVCNGAMLYDFEEQRFRKMRCWTRKPAPEDSIFWICFPMWQWKPIILTM